MGASPLALAKSIYYIQWDPLSGTTFLHNTAVRGTTQQNKNNKLN